MNLPEIKGPEQKRLPFKEKLKWTLITLVLFFILSNIELWGLGPNSLQQFEFLALILGASFGSILSLGIGPIVTASIVLQLLKGSGILKLDTNTHDGRVFFQGLQKILALVFIVFEAIIYVYLGGLSPDLSLAPSAFRSMQMVLVAQLCLGGVIVLFMDEIINKWGFGSGISLFIAAGVSSQVFIRAFSPLTQSGIIAFGTGQAPIGVVWVFFRSLIGGEPINAMRALFSILMTLVVFAFAVYAQAMKVEIPLSFGRVRGHGVRWPLNFIYTSNIPVILVAALGANIQLWARLLQGNVEGKGLTSGFLHWISVHFFGQFAGNSPISGMVRWSYAPNLLDEVFAFFSSGVFNWISLAQAAAFAAFMMVGAVIFSIFWVQTAGMDARSQAKQIMSSGLQIPGFRRDERVLESILKRYIFPLTIMGGLTVGFLAASADVVGALTSGTGILLTVMIIYRLYEEIAQQHMMDMYPALRKMMG
ncbi:MAG: preprotein translocase subunit SecY [Nanoarchaeota archaeon]|nr:preprotein translocase subunit SecY [Nanoarchaeota archaeon]|tara:strand:- start:159 stop:1589 length:1431 start_codon:yes stop_codon:yes gene_type:complete